MRQGSPGQRVTAQLEMRILSDIGLVGAPNAGKSSLLRALTAASPKVPDQLCFITFLPSQPSSLPVQCTQACLVLKNANCNSSIVTGFVYSDCFFKPIDVLARCR